MREEGPCVVANLKNDVLKGMAKAGTWYFWLSADF
jgi:hypothetical protein